MPDTATHRVKAIENILAGDICHIESGVYLRRMRDGDGPGVDWVAHFDVRNGDELDLPFHWPNPAWIIETNRETGRSGYVPNPCYPQSESSVSFEDGMKALAGLFAAETEQLPNGTYRHTFTAR
jgi:hypothetical protein